MPKIELTNELVEQYTPMVQKVARVQWKQATILETEDIEQAVWEYVLREGNRVFAKPDETPRTSDEIEGLMHRAAAKFCRSQREDYQYFSGAFVYSGDEVAALLEEQAWAQTEDVVDIEGRLDVMAAFERCSPAERRALYKAYGMKDQKLSASERARKSDGLLKVTTILNSGQAYERVEVGSPAVEARLQGAVR